MPRKSSKPSIKPPPLTPSPAPKRPHTTTPTSKSSHLRMQETEQMLEKIRSTPIYDRYGRPHYEGTPIGSGDKAWRRQHGVGAKYSRQCSLQGIGITRDSFLPYECKVNDRTAMLDTPRSNKLSTEVLTWAKKYQHLDDPSFMKQLRLVQKRVVSVDTLPNVPLAQKEELFDCIYKIANYSLLDKRQIGPPIGTASREQMTKAQNWQGDTSGSSTDVFYFPSFALTDKRLPRTVFGE